MSRQFLMRIWIKRNFHFLWECRFMHQLWESFHFLKSYAWFYQTVQKSFFYIFIQLSGKVSSTIRPENKLSLQSCVSCITVILGKVLKSGGIAKWQLVIRTSMVKIHGTCMPQDYASLLSKANMSSGSVPWGCTSLWPLGGETAPPNWMKQIMNSKKKILIIGAHTSFVCPSELAKWQKASRFSLWAWTNQSLRYH